MISKNNPNKERFEIYCNKCNKIFKVKVEDILGKYVICPNCTNKIQWQNNIVRKVHSNK